MTMSTCSEESRDRRGLRRVVERLLAWGFSPRAISEQLNCSTSWVYAVRRERAALATDVEDALDVDRLVEPVLR